MTPLPHYPKDTRQFHNTCARCKARNPDERFFGVLKGTLRCLSCQRILMYEPGFAGRIVNACAVLHIKLRYRLPVDGDFYDQAEHVPEPVINVGQVEEQAGGPRAIAERIRSQLMRERFGQYRDGNEAQE